MEIQKITFVTGKGHSRYLPYIKGFKLLSCFRGPVISVDIGFKDVVRSGLSLVLHDTAIKRFAKGSLDGVKFDVEISGEYTGFDEV
jgi:hypothetical protein